MADSNQKRPQTTVVLAMSADGKIADVKRSPARFSSSIDQTHLEKQLAAADAVLFGAGTLRTYGTTISVSDPQLLRQRLQQHLPPQPLQIVASLSGEIDPQIRFFRQEVSRWLLTTTPGARRWHEGLEFERILVCEAPAANGIDWVSALQQLASLGISRLAVTGGGELVASLIADDLIDEFWLTVCPLILGGADAPTPVEGTGFVSEQLAPRLELLSAEVINQEVFLHYQRQRIKD
jgi:5-amino-6-(5-phosphoribosylamino)uracil reductase